MITRLLPFTLLALALTSSCSPEMNDPGLQTEGQTFPWTVERVPEALLTMSLIVSEEEQPSLREAVHEFAREHRYQLREQQVPKSSRTSMISGVLSIHLTKGNQRIPIINPFERTEFTVVFATDETSEPLQILTRAREAFEPYIRRHGFALGAPTYRAP